ncbi:MAG: 3-phosphoshikimate 1-carboxyvinyltransferase [Chlamydiae bacterium]|nr:3-phosphoshikimate 1-carboxyvinyltransferase [Chlamydiota bacterium]
MTSIIIQPSKLQGEIDLPTSKSHSIRSIIFASLAKGKSRLYKLLDSPDIEQALKACQMMGAKITYTNEFIEIEGTNGTFNPPEGDIDSGNSGQVLRFIGALAALGHGRTTLTGDESVRTNRPVKPLLDALNALGASAKSVLENDCAPIVIEGPACAGKVTVKGEDSQPVSGILMLAAFLEGETEITVKKAGEKPWIDLTLSWFDRMHIPFEKKGYSYYKIKGKNTLQPFEYVVPGDFSSAAFPVAAAFATKSTLTLKNIDMDEVQGDKKFFDALNKMGATFNYNATKKEMLVDGTQPLKGCELDVNDYIDAITILAVIGCLAEGTTTIKNAAIARKKESDRISCICKELKKMNAEIEETPDGLIVKKSELRDATVESHDDHRIAMSLTIAGLFAKGTTIIQNIHCIKKSYPSFVDHLSHLGAEIKVK